MSNDFAVKAVTIEKIMDHENADRLEVANMEGLGWNVVVAKDSFKVGDTAIYIPTSSVIPVEVETALFGPDSKIKLKGSRVRAIKIRGAVSEGMLARPETLGLKNVVVGNDYAKKLKIEKYEPPAPREPGMSNIGRKASQKETNPNFRKYTSINRIQNFKTAFSDDQVVIVTEKLHGCNFRAGWVAAHRPQKFWRRLWWDIQGAFGARPEYQFVFGSRNQQLQDKLLADTYYEKNVWAKMVRKYDLKKKLGMGEVVYGEIIGPGIQANYHYDIPQGEHELVCFDVEYHGSYTNFDAAKHYCKTRGLKFVIELDREKFANLDLMQYDGRNSFYAPGQKVMEGVVLRSVLEESAWNGRKVYKWISPTYDSKDSNTDFH